MFSLICAWLNVWVNNGDAGELRRHSAHYDITIMEYMYFKPYAIFQQILDVDKISDRNINVDVFLDIYSIILPFLS